MARRTWAFRNSLLAFVAALVGVACGRSSDGESRSKATAEDAGKPMDRGGARQDPDGGKANSRANEATAQGDASVEGTVPVPSSSEPIGPPTAPAPTGSIAPGTTVTATVGPPLPMGGMGGLAGAPTYEAGGTPVYVGMGGRGVGGGYPVGGGYGPGGGYNFGGWSGIGGSYPTMEVPDPSVPLPEGCGAATRPGSDTWCNLQADCGGTTWHASCYDSQGAWSCQCSSSQGSQTFQLDGGSSSTACVKSLELCPTIDQLALTEGVCELSNASASASYCHLQEACPRSTDVGDGFTLTTFEYPSANCSDTDGEWSCACDAGGTLVRYPVADGDPLAICSAAVTRCTDAAVEFTESMQCIPLNQSATETRCNSSSDCTQAASLGELPVEAYGSLTTTCSREGMGPWACTCAVGSDPLELELEGEVGWEICTEANAACSAQLDLTDSARGGPYYGAGGAGPY